MRISIVYLLRQYCFARHIPNFKLKDAGWSLIAQCSLLRVELQGLVHDSLYESVHNPPGCAQYQWSALRREGFRALLQLWRLQGLCIKLAHTRLQARSFPEKSTLSSEADALQAEITRLFDRKR